MSSQKSGPVGAQGMDGGPEAFARAVLGLDAPGNGKPPLHGGHAGWQGDNRQMVWPHVRPEARTGLPNCFRADSWATCRRTWPA